MKTYYVKILIFTFLINTLLLPQYENYQNNHYNIRLIPNNTQRTTIKSRLLAQTQNHNAHYHNDPELKEIIDKLNEEAIKKYQQAHHPYEQLKEVVQKKVTKPVGGHVAEPMSTIEKELLETYEEVFGNQSHTLNSGRYPNDDDESDDSSSCECTDINNAKLAKTKGRDKYLKHLKQRCTRGIGFCSIGTAFLTLIGLIASKKAALAALASYQEGVRTCVSSSFIFYIFDTGSLTTAIKTGSTCASFASVASDIAVPASTAATTTIFPFSIAIYVLIAIIVLLIILYIWLYRRRKNSWKHECKKHLCK
ncbi:PIR protein, putative [Plasmodium sp. gorilla clade G1]|nr:PIR protein, putative [Plasmodium sp. gorilla clade G1]